MHTPPRRLPRNQDTRFWIHPHDGTRLMRQCIGTYAACANFCNQFIEGL